MELSENNRNKSTDPVIAKTSNNNNNPNDPDPKNNNNKVSFKEPVHTIESIIPKRLINKKEIIRGYVLFLLIALVLAAIIFVVLAMFFWRDNGKDQIDSENNNIPPRLNKPNVNQFDIHLENNTTTLKTTLSETTTNSTFNPENKKDHTNKTYNQYDAFTRQLTEINTQIEETLQSHFESASKILYNPDDLTGTLNPSPNSEREPLQVDLGQLESGWFSLEASKTFIAFKTHYDKLGADSLELKINHKTADSIATRHVFSKTGFPSEIEVTTNQTNLKIEFNWSLDNKQVTLSVQNGDYYVGGIVVENTFLDELNAKNYDILSPIDFDNIVENYLRMQRKGTGFGRNDENGDNCDNDLLIHAWQCTQGSAQNEGTKNVKFLEKQI